MVNLLCFVYPARASFASVDASDRSDVKLWLVYWVVYAFFQLLETSWEESLLGVVPFYFAFKLGFLVWCQMPSTRGAAFVHSHILAPFLKKHQARLS